ncbi:MAG: epoxyqueuosine reductase QueH [Clostridia bacterium]|nr:epoxyqueuosine reductase QueH [Clostridia bacterium]
MNKQYEQCFQELLNEIPTGTKLLLHSCCAPCSSACLERLKDKFDVTVLYYNPNIDDEAEYQKRKAEQIRFLQQTGWAKFIDCDHEKEKFTQMAQGLENEPERGKRCYSCYALRLDKTAQTAKENGFAWFCSTLSLSPYKNADWLNEIGERLEKQYGVRYLVSDFKKKGGYLRSLQLSAEYGLYRQNFCGCRFSKRDE